MHALDLYHSLASFYFLQLEKLFVRKLNKCIKVTQLVGGSKDQIPGLLVLS